MEKMRSVLFVCAANICRSPLAMGLFTIIVMPSTDDWQIASAGIFATSGYPAAQNTLDLLKQKGLDLSRHRSCPITREMVQHHNLILTMERGQKEALQIGFPEYAQKIFLLSEMIGEYWEIIDPIGGSFCDFEDAARDIEYILLKGFEKIFNLAAVKAEDK
jgi:protein-tyrosine-phosphatase